MDNSKLKIILVSGNLHINVGREPGKRSDPATFYNTIILSTGEIYTDKNDCEAKFNKSSVCAAKAHDKNKTTYYFDDKVEMDAVTKTIVEQFITANTTPTVNPAQVVDVLTNKPTDIKYE